MGGPLPPEFPVLAMVANLDGPSILFLSIAVALLCGATTYLLMRKRAS